MNWAEIISNNAFPVVACIALAWYVYHLTKQHSEEMKEITKAVNKLSSGIDKILSRLG